MRYLTLAEVVELHRRVIGASGGTPGLRDLGALESALAQPRASFGGTDLYARLPEEAAALAFSIAQNHAFLDGNKRVAHAAMETFLVVDEQERLMIDVAAGRASREQLTS